MSSDKSSSKGKAVVVKEEPLDTELVKKTNQGRSQEEGSSSLASNQPAAKGTTESVEDVPLPMANVTGPQQHGDDNLHLFLKHIILQCVVALGTENIMAANASLQYLLSVATEAAGDTLQRVAFVFAEALARRVMRSLPGLAWALQLQVPPLQTTPAATNAVRQSFATLCPLVRVAATAANHAILEAMAAEHFVHVVDLGGANLNQWLQLLCLFAARPGGPPSLRLTIVNEQEKFLSGAAGLLTQEAVRLHVPFVFNPVRSHIDRLSPTIVADLGVVQGQGEALVITSTLQLHRLIADEVTIELPVSAQQTTSHKMTKADALLRVLRDLMPKLMVLTEQEADHNGADLSDRVLNAFDYYEVLFRDLEAGGGDPRVLLRVEMMDIIACDGVMRRERHEKMAHWAQRMQVAGFEPIEVGIDEFNEATTLAHQLSGDGKLWMFETRKIDKGCIILDSRKVPIFSVSAWRPV